MEQSNNVYKEYIPRIKACKLLRDFLTLQKIFHITRGDHGAVYCRRGRGERN